MKTYMVTGKVKFNEPGGILNVREFVEALSREEATTQVMNIVPIGCAIIKIDEVLECAGLSADDARFADDVDHERRCLFGTDHPQNDA